MEVFKKVESGAVPVMLDEVDTDQIIPAAFLTSVSRDGYGQSLFKGLCDSDPTFALNQEKYNGREILLVGNNFGCGSSREHAVWALAGRGFRVVIGKSFADIFSGNSAKNGLLLVVLPGDEVEHLAEQAGLDDSFSLTVDLEKQLVLDSQGREYSFDYDSFRKHCLLNGLDDVDYIRSKSGEVEAYRASRKEYRFASVIEAGSENESGAQRSK